MSLREELLADNNGILIEAASVFAHRLNYGDPARFKAGYSQSNAILAAVEMFPEVTEEQIRVSNNWESPPRFAERQ